MHTAQQAIHKYRQGQILGLTPEVLLVRVYGEAMKACDRRDAKQAVEVIQVLKKSLRSNQNKALGYKLEVLYNSCLALIA